MKHVIKTFATLLILCFFQTILFAQDSGGSSTVTTSTHTETQTWYTQPWVWIVGAAVFILLLVALIRGNNKTTTSSTTVKRTDSDAV